MRFIDKKVIAKEIPKTRHALGDNAYSEDNQKYVPRRGHDQGDVSRLRKYPTTFKISLS